MVIAPPTPAPEVIARRSGPLGRPPHMGRSPLFVRPPHGRPFDQDAADAAHDTRGKSCERVRHASRNTAAGTHVRTARRQGSAEPETGPRGTSAPGTAWLRRARRFGFDVLGVDLERY